MYKRIKVVTALVTVLVVFTLLEIATGSMFFRTVDDDRQNFIFNQDLNTLQREMGLSWMALVHARVSLARAGTLYALNPAQAATDRGIQSLLTQAIHELDEANQARARFDNALTDTARNAPEVQAVQANYTIYHDALVELAAMLKSGRFQDYLDQPTQGYQDQFSKTYNQWLTTNNALIKQGLENNNAAWLQTQIILAVVALMTLLIIILVWIGMYRILLRPLTLSIGHIRHIADGDLTQPIIVEGKNEMTQLAASLRNMQQSLIRTVSSVRDGSNAINSGAIGISAGSSDLSARTEQQAASLEETAASMEQLTSTVRQNADNARQASKLALSASETAQRGGKVVDGVVETMKDIAGSSKKISDITSVIDGIAFQTNILALNAAVEAARAGEQGRGFAVVAGEVRSLAQRSASAAREIKSLIEESVSRVDAGAVLVESAGETMSEIVSSVTRVTDIMGEISSASDEQSWGIDQVNTAVNEMDRVTQQNVTLVQESATSAAALERQASELAQAVALFRISKETHSGAVNSSREPSQMMPLEGSQKALPATVNVHDNWETF
ncbi:methyl-accepting chemotaxis protein II [Erwinia sp. OLTSP20]|uniref:methyl-accepting chemotaxis protein n=1 Tax=unclassified Erwinia TaxID=2622719 RepID=UPI000C18D196|nr:MULTISPECIES: methyl-accepting chemotaxis protein [unclassified Erwinia]PIJ50940.1 methyl-accepting chemotaxis protein II [Erwinia sp. OAMSP11]PIJ75933.1 methyl-accepting chemotaxis protein II [Erwinia sp. OLSSP12]PIJ83621.1 methyl-accepting chemotaxis protein II [Erwinia sp. OLCASP19]PIJ87477.1 methyl-accepting chemotaxis protein II [Erwinia sp. OLMTSP26]PIJ89025.1 methyl-accepting chemotaxis protein II [Erwinia sp. OLMDSP33]